MAGVVQENVGQSYESETTEGEVITAEFVAETKTDAKASVPEALDCDFYIMLMSLFG